jgi:transposase-like protein
MNKRSEIISMVERRRHWPAEGKLRIVEEALAPGAVMQRLPTAMVSAVSSVHLAFCSQRPA